MRKTTAASILALLFAMPAAAQNFNALGTYPPDQRQPAPRPTTPTDAALACAQYRDAYLAAVDRFMEATSIEAAYKRVIELRHLHNTPEPACDTPAVAHADAMQLAELSWDGRRDEISGLAALLARKDNPTYYDFRWYLIPESNRPTPQLQTPRS